MEDWALDNLGLAVFPEIVELKIELENIRLNFLHDYFRIVKFLAFEFDDAIMPC